MRGPPEGDPQTQRSCERHSSTRPLIMPCAGPTYQLFFSVFTHEALLVIGSPHPECEGVSVDRTACRAIADFFGGEVDRIAADARPWRGRR
jgi:hypothetical protein